MEIDDMNTKMKNEGNKNAVTVFLENNKIWFVTIIPVLVSIAVAAAGVASCWADIQQARVSYYNYKNEETYENIWLGRASDPSKRTNGNNILFLQPALEKRYHDENNTKSEVVIDSLNSSDEEIVDKCEEYAEELFEKWDL